MEHLTEADKYNRLEQRRDYLKLRVEAKKKMKWHYDYDESEEKSLSWALELLKDKKNAK